MAKKSLFSLDLSVMSVISRASSSFIFSYVMSSAIPHLCIVVPHEGLDHSGRRRENGRE